MCPRRESRSLSCCQQNFLCIQRVFPRGHWDFSQSHAKRQGIVEETPGGADGTWRCADRAIEQPHTTPGGHVVLHRVWAHMATPLSTHRVIAAHQQKSFPPIPLPYPSSPHSPLNSTAHLQHYRKAFTSGRFYVPPEGVPQSFLPSAKLSLQSTDLSPQSLGLSPESCRKATDSCRNTLRCRWDLEMY